MNQSIVAGLAIAITLTLGISGNAQTLNDNIARAKKSIAGGMDGGGGGYHELLEYIANHPWEFEPDEIFRTSKYKRDFCLASFSAKENLRVVYGFTEQDETKTIKNIFHSAVIKFLDATPSKYQYLETTLRRANDLTYISPTRPIQLTADLFSKLTRIWEEICIQNSWRFKQKIDLVHPRSNQPIVYYTDPLTRTLLFDPKKINWIIDQRELELNYKRETIELSSGRMLKTLALHELLTALHIEKDTYTLSGFFARYMGRACYFTLILSGGDFKSIEDLKINWRNIAPQGISPRDYWAQVACYDGSSPYDPYTPYLSWENEEAILRVLEIDEK